MDRQSRNAYTRNYPRSAGAHLLDAEGPVGLVEMVALTGRSVQSCYKYMEKGLLPPADGPKVNGRPTWLRSTFLAWAYAKGKTLGPNKTALASHEEAARWHETVPPESIRSVAEGES